MCTPYSLSFRSSASAALLALLMLSAAPARSAEPSEAERLLQTAQQALAAGNWEESARLLAALEKQPADAALGRCIAVFRRDLFTVVRLDELRNEYPVDAKGFNAAILIAEYRQTFHLYGLEPETIATATMREHGRLSLIRSHLMTALDEWARMVPDDQKTVRNNLLDFADALDDSELRCEIRAAMRAENRPHQVRLAEQTDIGDLTPSLLLLLARMLDRADESVAAINLLRRGQRRFPGDCWIQLHLGAMLLEQQPPQPQEAITCFRAVVSLRPDLAAAQLELAQAFWLLDNFLEAEKAAREAVRLQPQWAQTHLLLAHALAVQSKYAAAEVAGREAVRLNPNDCQAQVILGLTLMAEEKWPDAEVALRLALALNKDKGTLIDAALMHSLGVTLKEQHKYDEAEKVLSEAVQRNKDDDEVRLELAQVFFAQERYTEAETVLCEIIRRNKDNVAAHALLATALFAQHKMKEMATPCLEVRRLDPANLCGVGNLVGLALLWQERLPETEVVLRQVLQSEFATTGTWQLLALTLLAQKKEAEAEQVCRAAVTLLPNVANLHSYLAALLDQRGRFEEAEASFREAVRVAPDDAQMRENLVKFLKEQHRDQEAEALEVQWEATTKAEKAHLDEAWTLKNHERYLEALNELCLACAHNPNFKEWKRFVELYDLMGEPDLAATEYKRELAVTPNDLDLLNELADRLYRMGDAAQGEQYLRRALAADSSSERTWVNLGIALAAQGRIAESLDASQHALRSDLAYCNIASVQVSQGRLAAARTMYHKALELDPNNSVARAGLAELERTK